MPANVETMFSVREIPWHGIGTIVEKQLTAAKAIEAAGLDWDVKLLPVQYEFNGERKTFDRKFVSVRSDTGAALGTVGSMYTPLQNREAFSFMDSLVDSGDAKYETAGSLEGGRQVWMMMELPEGVNIGGVDPIKPYLLLNNSHDGSRSVTAATTMVRVVCQNTLNMAMKGAIRKWNVRHVGSMSTKLLDAREALDLAFTYMGVWEEQAEALLNKKMSLKRFDVFQDRVVTDLELGDRLAEDFKARTRQLFAEGDTLVAVQNTEWAALNAVSEYFEHMRKGKRTSDDVTLKSSFDPGSAAAKARQHAYALLSG